MKTADTEEAKEIIQSGQPVLVDFSASWCGPCKRLSPVLEDIESEYPDIRFIKLDIDNDMEFAQEMDVSSVPTIIIFNNQKEINRANGLVTKDFLAKFLNG